MSDLRAIMQKAVSLHQAGKLHEAQRLYSRALQLNPKDPGIINLQGVIAHQLGQHDEAIRLIGQAITMRPGAADMHVNLASALMSLHRYAEAVDVLRRALNLSPNLLEAHNNLIQSLTYLGKFDDAIAAADRAIQLAPGDPRFPLALARSLRDAGRIDRPIEILTALTQSHPQNALAWCNLSELLAKQSKPGASADAARRAIALSPTMAQAYNNLANALNATAKPEEALQAHRRGLALDPDNATAHSNLLFGLHYHPLHSPQEIFQEHLEWDRRHGHRQQPMSHSNSRDPDRKLRIGYVSPDFRLHAAANFIEPLLAAHDRENFFIACYSNSLSHDAVSRRLASYVDLFREITRLDDEQAAELIRADQIDVLVDLAGHTARHRLLVFARKPAPVQFTYLGYPNTTGMSAIDARFTDALCDPPASGAINSEKLIRLPPPFLAFRGPEYAPAAAPLSALANGYVTFGSFNNLTKLTPMMMDLWAKILHAVAKSRLVLKADALAEQCVRDALLAEFASRGIAADRITLSGMISSMSGHLDFYRHVDIGLDTFPYHGTTTTAEALFMGVPVITIAGDAHVSRVGVSLMTSVGLGHLVADDADGYLRVAVKLAGNVTALADLRSNLRPRLLASPLGDSVRLARGIETAYRRFFADWCRG